MITGKRGRRHPCLVNERSLAGRTGLPCALDLPLGPRILDCCIPYSWLLTTDPTAIRAECDCFARLMGTARVHSPSCHCSCRLDRSVILGHEAMKWHDTDKHSKNAQ